MTPEPGFALHPEAARDITEIWEYIAEDNPVAARRVRAEILSRIRAVVPFPHSGHTRPDLTGRPLRFLHGADRRPLGRERPRYGRMTLCPEAPTSLS